MSENPLTYDAFISYRHVEPDRRWAKWLHTALERYRVPKDLSRARQMPDRLRRIFRDEEEMAASPNLSDEINTALEQSRFLIVVCSPSTPESEWVSQEIVHFSDLGRSDRIFALLVEGEPKDALPPALRKLWSALCFDACSNDEELEVLPPRLIDAREIATKKVRHQRHDAKIRLVAALLGYSEEELNQRDGERRIRRLTGAAAGITGLLVLMGALAWIAVQERERAEQQEAAAEEARLAEQQARERADDTLKFMIDSLFREVEAIRDPRLIVEVLSRILEHYESTPQIANTDYWRTYHPQVLITQGYNLVAAGDYERALEVLRDGLARVKRLADHSPQDSNVRVMLLTGTKGLGFAESFRGNLDAAIEHYRSAVSLAVSFAREDPGNRELQELITDIHIELAMVLKNRKDYQQALRELKPQLTRQQRLADDDPNTTRWEANIARTHETIGLIQQEQENLDDALHHYQAALSIRQRQADQLQDSTTYAALKAIHVSVADTLLRKREYGNAGRHFRKALELQSEQLAGTTNVIAAVVGIEEGVNSAEMLSGQREPKTSHDHLVLAIVLSYLGDFEQSAIHFNEALEDRQIRSDMQRHNLYNAAAAAARAVALSSSTEPLWTTRAIKWLGEYYDTRLASIRLKRQEGLPAEETAAMHAQLLNDIEYARDEDPVFNSLRQKPEFVELLTVVLERSHNLSMSGDQGNGTESNRTQ